MVSSSSIITKILGVYNKKPRIRQINLYRPMNIVQIYFTNHNDTSHKNAEVD